MNRQGQPLAFIMMDVDHFKQFNDRFGQEAGDEVLRAIAANLQNHVRAGDIPCRFGGEEFILILPATSQEEACNKAEWLRQAVEALQLQYRGRSLGSITLSLGIAMFPEHRDPGALLRAADAALYQAKSGGRNRIAIGPDIGLS